MFHKLGNWFRNVMMGRYGADQLNRGLLIFGIVLLLLGSVLGRWNPWLNLLTTAAYVPLLWCMFRMYSRNIAARQKENRAFLQFFTRLKDRDHRYFCCPQCRQTVRVPRGRGRIKIRCPRCSIQFEKHS